MSFTFTASTTQVSHLSDIFQAISSVNSQALMIISPNGITLYAESNHISNASSTIDPSLFATYNFYSEDTNNNTQHHESSKAKEEVRLGVDIRLISDSFNNVPQSSSRTPTTTSGHRGGAANSEANPSATRSHAEDDFGGNSSSVDRNRLPAVTCYITYNGEGYPLIVEFEDSLVSEKIEFLTFYTDLQYPYQDVDEEDDSDLRRDNFLTIDHSEIQFELILKSDVLSNLLRDLQQINTVELYLYISNEIRTLGRKSQFGGPQIIDNQVNFISKGPIGLSKLIFPNEKTILEKIEIFEKRRNSSTLTPVNSSIISVYNFTQFNKIFKSVKLSTKCKIQKDLNGTLSVQLLCKNVNLPSYSGTLITFNMLALSTTDEEEYIQMNINNVFDKESYDYVKDYGRNKGGNGKGDGKENTKRQRLNISEYEPLDIQIDRTFDDEGRRKDRNRSREDELGEDVAEGDARGIIDIPLFL